MPSITDTEVFKPPTRSNGGLIVAAHGSDGLVDNDHGLWKTTIRNYAEELSDRGFTVAIPDYFAIARSKPPTPQEFPARDRWQTALADRTD